MVEKLLVEGTIATRADGSLERVYPSVAELARRFGVYPNSIHRFARELNLDALRAEYAARNPLPARPPTRPKPTPEPQAKPPPPPPPPPPAPKPAPIPEPDVVADESDEVVEVPEPPPPPPAEEPRPIGRPRRADAPVIPYEELDRLLVFGEVVEDEDGRATTEYPSYRNLAERYGVAFSLIASYAKSHNVPRRREQAKLRIAHRTEEKIIEMRAETFALSKEDSVRIIDSYLANFEIALKEGRVRFDSPSDFNTMARLKEFLQGGADTRQEVNASVTLDALQERHAQWLRSGREASSAERGIIDVTPHPPAEGTKLSDPLVHGGQD
jgi:hypothetical protein